MLSASPQPSGPGPRSPAALLAQLGLPVAAPAAPAAGAEHPDLEWARSGAMALTGRAEAAPLLAPAALASRARQVVAALRVLGPSDAFQQLDGPALLGEHAACFGHQRQGRTSPGGSCRLLEAADGWLALNLARPDDRGQLPAWLERNDAPGPEAANAWSWVESCVAGCRVEELVERGRLLGLPVSPASLPPPQPPAWLHVDALGSRVERHDTRRPRVLDLTALWAGPLCGHLLRLGGARVVKVESTRRPDGLRRGNARFFDLLNAHKESVALDFEAEEGRAELRRLLERADVVLEGSRPRALRQLGVDARAWLAAQPGRVWTSITGYGRREPEAGWVAFGDDAAVAAGLAVATGSPGAPLFCGDAIADPLAGLHAAVATRAGLAAGGGVLLDVSLRDGVAHLVSQASGVREARVERVPSGGYEVVLGEERLGVLPPRARASETAARKLGADTERVLSQPC